MSIDYLSKNRGVVGETKMPPTGNNKQRKRGKLSRNLLKPFLTNFLI
jgi:hypothetical protein